MKRNLMTFILLILFASIISVEKVSAQAKITRKTTVSAKRVWAGVWNDPSRFASGTLTIKSISVDKFKFELESTNGANSGEISGIAKIKGAKAVFDDRLSTAKDAEKLGCVLTFTHKGNLINVEQTTECSNYAGNAVSFNGEYAKGKPKPEKVDFVDLEVFPNAKIEGKFKTLVGLKEYKNFLDDFQLISGDDDLDNLNANVFSACVRGICPYNAGIIMFDGQENIWAAVMNIEDPKKSRVNYYTNAADWTDKMPKTIEVWVKNKGEMNDNLTVIYKSKK